MIICGASIAPSDAHSIIKENASLVLDKKGGEGFVRKIIEETININSMTLEELQELL